MNLVSLIALLKSLVPVLEPIGEQGVEQLFQIIQGEVDKLSNSDFKDAATILLPALKQFALLEIRKLK